MNLAEKERKSLVVGGIVVGAILVISYVIAPVVRAWCSRGDELKPKAEYVARLRVRARKQDRLMTKRNVLVRRLGSLVGPDEPGVQQQADKPKPPEPAPDAEEQKPGEGEVEAAAAEESTGAAPEAGEGNPEQTKVSDGVSLAAHLERVAKSVGVKIKRISPKKRSRGGRKNKHFTPVALQISIEGNIKTFVSLLHALEKGERFVRVEQIQLRRDVKGNNVEVTLELVGYEAAG